MSSVKVVYIGEKPEKRDNVAGTNTVWHGHGDVQAVPLEAWIKMAKHVDVWRLQEEAAKSAKASAPAPAPAPAPTPAPAAEALFGTDHPAQIDIGGVEVQLGIVVAGAHVESGLTAAEWNALQDDDRRALVDEHIEKLRTAAADEQLKAAAESAKKASASTAATKAEAKPKARGGRKAKSAEA